MSDSSIIDLAAYKKQELGEFSIDDIFDDLKGKLKDGLVVGWSNDGEFILSCNPQSLEQLVYLCELAKTAFIKVAHE